MPEPRWPRAVSEAGAGRSPQPGVLTGHPA